MSHKLLAVVMLLSAFVSLARAADPPATQPNRFVLTIYNPPEGQQQQYYGSEPQPPAGFAVVREVRPIDLLAGDNLVRFTDVATAIDPTTVTFKSLTAPDTTSVLEQNYEYDLVSGDKLLQKYLDKKVTVHVGHQTANGGTTPTVIDGNLLSFDETSLVLKTESSVEVISRARNHSGQALAAMDADLTVKPTLVWKIHAEQAGTTYPQVTYQTDNIGWRADYTLALNQAESASDVGAWVTIRNESGLVYPDASLKLIAGDVRRISPRTPSRPMTPQEVHSAIRARPRNSRNKPFSEYHLYTLQRTTSLPTTPPSRSNFSLPRWAVPVTKTYAYCGLPEQFRYF